MKRTLTILSMLLVTGLTNAQQQIANAGFESWDTKGDYTEPTEWYSLNALVQFGFDATTIMTTDAHGGTYAVRLESKASPFSDLSGVLCTGPILNEQMDADFTKMKVAFSGKPEKFEFYFKADPEPGDSSVISMCLTRWNVALQQTDTVGEASMLFYDSVGIYTHASIEVEYSSPLPPDSMFIIASSSADGFNPTVGSSLTLDDLLFVYPPTGVSNVSTQLDAVVYPNPAREILYVKMQESQKGTITVYDLLGNKVYNESFNGREIAVNTMAMAEGLYIIAVQTENGQTLTSKVSIKK